MEERPGTLRDYISSMFEPDSGLEMDEDNLVSMYLAVDDSGKDLLEQKADAIFFVKGMVDEGLLEVSREEIKKHGTIRYYRRLPK